MKKLHLVGITKESDGLVFSPRKGAKTGGFVVALDDELLASVEEARRGREGDEAPIEFEAANLPARRERPNSSLSPREIQARLRSGATIAEVAVQAGVGQDWVLRFADPILAEQARVVESAQRLTFAKSRLGPSVEPLAESVQWKLSDRGVRFSDDVFAAGWSAFNLHGTRWAVQFHYTSRQRHQVAEWEVDLRERTLTARNRLASDLGHVEAGRRRPRLEPPELGQPTDAPPASPPAGAGRKAGRRTVAAAARGRGTKAAPGAKAGTPPVKATAPTRSTKATPPVKATASTKATKATKSSKATATATAGAKRTSRESSPRKSRPAKKPAAETPTAEPVPERPTHLARPPSPMNMANRATALPGRRLTPYARPAPLPPPPPQRETSRGRPPPAAEPVPDEPWPAVGPSPPPARPRPTAAKARPAGRPAAKVVAPPIPRRPAKKEGEGDDDRPAVVILPSPPPESPGPGTARAGPRGTPGRTTPSRRASSGP